MAELEATIKKDFMVKRSLMKSRIKMESYKGRWFLLGLNFLRYCDGTIEMGMGKTKGEIPLSDILVVESIEPEYIGNRMCVFQIIYKTYGPEDIQTLYIQASHEENKCSWIAAIKEACAQIGVRLNDRYHKGVFRFGKYVCCDGISKTAPGCVPVNNPGQGMPEMPQPQIQKQSSQDQCPFPQNILQLPQVQLSVQQQLPGPALPVALPRLPQSGAASVLPGGFSQIQDPSAHPTCHSNSAGESEDRLPVFNHANGILTCGSQPQGNSLVPAIPQAQPKEQSQGQVPAVPIPKPRAKPAKAEKKALALYMFKAVEEGDLCLIKGEIYEVLDDSEPCWWKVKNKTGESGHVPSSYLQVISENDNNRGASLKQYDWYYSDTTPSRAEEILKQVGTEGCFLIRDSRKRGQYTLSVLCSEKVVKHYHIKILNNGMYSIVEGHSFSSLPELIVFHKENAAGLTVCLKSPPGSGTRCSVMLPSVGLRHDAKEILLSELTILEDLGAGNFGIVVHGKYKETIDVAVKMVRANCMTEKEFISEAKVMAMLNHKNLVILYGVCKEVSPIYIVTEFMKYGALLQYLKRNRHKLLDEIPKLLDMSIQVCDAMVYLESKKFIHRDLAARNCLVGESNIIKVADFGLARFVADEHYTPSSPIKFPVKWSAPEVLIFSKFSSKSDVWAFGILMWEIFTAGEMPYGNVPNIDLANLVCNKKKRLSRPPKCPELIFAIMYECWNSDSDKRLSFAQLKTNLDSISDSV